MLRPLPLALLIGLALAGPASANDLVRKGGVLGGTLTYEVSAKPTTSVIVLPSFNTGPTPLFLLDPLDLRVLDVGIDLLAFAPFLFTDAAGDASITLPLPANPGLHGVPLYAQAVEVTGFPTLFGEISNRTTVTLSSKDSIAEAAGKNYAPLFGHTAATLPDGRVAIVGGYDDQDPNGVKDTIGLFDPQTETTGQANVLMTDPRVLNTVTVMADGRLFIAGGADISATPKKSCDIYDPVTDTLTMAAPMTIARAGHAATLLPDGRIFVSGGVFAISSVNPLDNINNVTASCEIYDPVSNTWSPAPDLPNPRFGHATSMIPTFDWVLLSGGIEIGLFGLIIVSTDCQRYIPDPTGVTQGTWFPTSSMNIGRGLHESLVLDNGQIVAAGGGGVSIQLVPPALDVVPIASVETYDPILDQWTLRAPLNHARLYFDLFRADDGTLVAVGGNGQGDFLELLLGDDSFGIQPIEESTQGLLLWTETASQSAERFFGGMSALIDDGTRVAIFGETDDGDPTNNDAIELYVP